MRPYKYLSILHFLPPAKSQLKHIISILLYQYKTNSDDINLWEMPAHDEDGGGGLMIDNSTINAEQGDYEYGMDDNTNLRDFSMNESILSITPEEPAVGANSDYFVSESEPHDVYSGGGFTI
jgi:hypothetical protein